MEMEQLAAAPELDLAPDQIERLDMSSAYFSLGT